MSAQAVPDPIPMLLWCPCCNARHIDRGEFATKSHHTHACQSCGVVWRPAIVATVGVQFLPDFKNEPPSTEPAFPTGGELAYRAWQAETGFGPAWLDLKTDARRAWNAVATAVLRAAL